MALPKESSDFADGECVEKGMQKCGEFTPAVHAFVCWPVRKGA
ncbi:hypothetical protein [Cupriavidus basilensis]|nr:hypothetical protein [Cupriavidus basilensis]